MGIREEFVEGVKRFVEHAKTLDVCSCFRAIRCPCVRCDGINLVNEEDVKEHLYRKGFHEDFLRLHGIHGDVAQNNFVVGESSRSAGHNEYQDTRMTEMVHDAFGMQHRGDFRKKVKNVPNREAGKFYEQLHAASHPLFDGCSHSRLSVIVRLLSIKSDWNIAEGGMDSMIDLIKELVDPGLEVPNFFYKAKTLVSKLGLSSVRIDCCENGCMLYFKEDANLEFCKFCQHSRYKRGSTGNKISIKAMHYLPLIPKLKRLYASYSSAPHMRCHSENKRPTGIMCHPSDGEAWKHFDATYPDFAAEPRNIHLGLCADGFSPFQLVLCHIHVGLYLSPLIILLLKC